MGKKSKPFIDKKNASTYHLMHRSQRDVALDVWQQQQQQEPAVELEDPERATSHGSPEKAISQTHMILWPNPGNRPETDRAVLLPSSSQRGSTTGSHNKTLVEKLGDEIKSDQEGPAVVNPHSTMKEWKERLQAAGLLHDNPEKYLKPLTGQGIFVDAQSGQTFTVRPTEKEPFFSPEDALMEVVPGSVEAIALTADCMDQELAAALEADLEEGDYEELDDDFIWQASQEPGLAPNTFREDDHDDDHDNNEHNDDDAHHVHHQQQPYDAEEAFDYDRHIQRLMQKARMERQGDSGINRAHHNWAHQDQAFFSRLQSLREGHEFDEGHDDDGSGYVDGELVDWGDEGEEDGRTSIFSQVGAGIVSSLSPEEERALCEKFEATLAEYDSDEMGDCPDEEIQGLRPLEGDAQIEAALDEFWQDREDEVYIQGTYSGRRGGSGYSVLVGKRMVAAKDLDEIPDEELNGPPETIQEILAHAQELLAQAPQQPPTEEILFDGKSYFSEKQRSPWDCESILSTYSNLDNNPITIGATRRRKTKRRNRAVTPVDHDEVECDESVHQHIRLSAKTGLPIAEDTQHVVPSLYLDGCDDTLLSVNRGEARSKDETTEEKKARKAAVKRERQLARIQKKVTREVFRDEIERRAAAAGADDVGGKSVFRYS